MTASFNDIAEAGMRLLNEEGVDPNEPDIVSKLITRSLQFQ